MQNKEGDLIFFNKKNLKGQVTIFIIIGIIIVAAAVIFFVVRGNLGISNIPANIQPVYNSFLSCLEDKTKTGISILESRGGYIELPQFEPGNSFMPFSSQLNFFGDSIPYWYYVSGNNIQKEQIPSQQNMEKSLAIFIDDKIRECDYASYYSQGFEILNDEPSSSVSIKNNNVDVSMRMNLKISFGDDTSLIQNHKVSISSNLGELYNLAKTIYEKEKRESFLENYGIDTMRLYAPVDGVELTCSPKVWNADEVFETLKDAIETNTLALNTQSPKTNDEKYFSITGINGEARFINSKNWSSSFEILPAEENILISNPVGNQQGLGILGFCYVPYHFVYNINYPVLIQTYNGDETFQFPVAVVIKGNKPRVALESTASTITPELCPYKNTLTTVKTYDSNLNSIDSQISYECFGESCGIGSTSSGTLTTEFPQCINGFVIARAEGYQESREQYSTTKEGSVSVVLNKLYSKNINLKLNGANYDGKAIIYFTSEGNSKVVSYPEQKEVQLGIGQYEISVYIYKDSSIQLQESTQQECTTIPSSGIGGIFGITEKKCFEVKVPQQMISSVLAGGGKQDYYILEEDLKNSNVIDISAEELSTPTTLQQVQNNYIAFEDKKLEVNLR